MRTSLLALSSLILLLRAGAAEQTVTVTPQTLAAWSVSGADKSSMAQSPLLVLPAGAQLGRTFSGSAVILHLVSRPSPGATASDWPILEVGEVSLAFVGNGAQTKLVLGLGDDKQVELPWTVPATITDHGVDIVVGYDPVAGTGVVGVGDQSQSFQVASSSSPVEVLLTAGDLSTWPQDSMEVILLANDPSGADTSKSKPTLLSIGTGTDKLKSAVEKLLGKTGDGTNSSSATNDGATAKPAATPVYTLELFTPPAVRHGKADSLRTLLAQGKKS